MCPTECFFQTLLLSVSDCAGYVVEEMLEKYGIDRSEATGFCLVQCTTQTNSGPASADPSAREYYLEDEECPLAILMNHPPSRGNTQHIEARRRITNI